MHAEVVFTGAEDERRRIPLFEGRPYVVGRSRSCEIVLRHTRVSRNHAVLRLVEGAVEVEDLGSRNGTYVRGEKVTPGNRALLRNGDTVSIGAHALTIRLLTPETQLPLKLEGPDLAGYETLARIGTGAYSRVFSAIEQATGKLVAIKSLVAREDDDWIRFDREAELMRGLGSEHLVKVYGLYEGQATAHIVMEYVDGITAHELAKREQVSFASVIRIGLGLAKGLGHLHAAKIVHRDVKPSNVLLPYAGGVKLTDLGIAKEVGAGGLTEPGQGLGTLAFMAPEQAIDARGVDTRSDLYGLGATLYYLVTGKPPLIRSRIRTQADLREAVEVLTSKTPPPLTVIRPEAPEWLAAAIHRLLQREPVDRYQSVEAVRDLFAQHGEELEPSEERSMTETWHGRASLDTTD